jgi:hypothetical protein
MSLTLSVNFYGMSLYIRYYTAIICFFLFLISSILIPGISAQNQCDATTSNDKVNGNFFLLCLRSIKTIIFKIFFFFS